MSSNYIDPNRLSLTLIAPVKVNSNLLLNNVNFTVVVVWGNVEVEEGTRQESPGRLVGGAGVTPLHQMASSCVAESTVGRPL